MSPSDAPIRMAEDSSRHIRDFSRELIEECSRFRVEQMGSLAACEITRGLERYLALIGNIVTIDEFMSGEELAFGITPSARAWAAIRGVYSEWLACCPPLEKVANDAIALDLHLPLYADFRAWKKDVEWFLRVPLERFGEDRHARARDAAVEALRSKKLSRGATAREEILRVVSAQPGARDGEIADVLGLDAFDVAVLLRELEADGLVGPAA